MFGERFRRARSASGLSMKELGDSVGVSANMIKKYEHGESMPSSPVLIRLAKTLGVKSEYFFRPNTIVLGEIQYRKRASLPKKTLHKIEAEVVDQAERWMELKNLWPNFPIDSPNLDLPVNTLHTYEDVEMYANSIREKWGLGSQGITDLTALLEEHGYIVIMISYASEGMCDGLQAVIEDMPIIVCQSNGDGTRQRFTMAHELAHHLLSSSLDSNLDEELCCHRFAGSFLLPLDSLKREIGEKRHSLEIAELYHLKHRYGISMQACIRRAFDTGIISQTEYTNVCKLFSSRGWKKQEPGEPYRCEQSSLFTRLVYRALGEHIIGESKAAELLGKDLMEFHADRFMGKE
jgi:Zn-dependent peptidase ImmA (M78 family)/transcriptional regulator with XRE-family HTH domain